MKSIAYLDYNATAPLKPEVVQAMADILALPLNASSAHTYGRQAKRIVEDTRRALAEYINCWPQEIIWCGSATEANNAVLAQFKPDEILISAIEHSSIFKCIPESSNHIPVTSEGVVDLSWLEKRLAAPTKPKLISVMAANNETGILQPIKEIVALAHASGVLVHTDAVQLFGKVPVDVSAIGVDYMTLGFHKSGAPQGLGALFVANGKPFSTFVKGGGQEFNRRAGTENIAAIAGLQAWLKLPDDYAHFEKLRGWLDEMEAIFLTHPACGGGKGGAGVTGDNKDVAHGEMPPLTSPPQAVGIVGLSAPRLPNTSCLILPHQSQEITLMQADLAGICISAGSACSSGRIEASHVLIAMGYSKEQAGRAIRISGGWGTTKEDIELLEKFLNKSSVK